MAYRKYRHRPAQSESKQRAMTHVAAFKALDLRLGPLVRDVQKVFFELPADQLNLLLDDYEQRYGFEAGSYARETLPLWKSRARKMSGQTMERLLDLVPRYLSTEARYDLVRKLADYHQARNQITRNVQINLKEPGPGLQRFSESLGDFETHDVLKRLPEEAINIATWLSDNDVTVARHILSEVDRQMIAQIKEIASEAESTIRRLISNANTQRYQEVIRFPTGTLSVTASRPSACFIANEVYGNSAHPDVEALRHFRDARCQGTWVGERFVSWYYRYSPALANFLSRHRLLRSGTRVVLSALIRIFSKKAS